jgi:geranylgeranyl transferase type-2 subunit alpha
MESLVYYKRLLLSKYAVDLTTEDREQLVSSCICLLDELQIVDPDRKLRYVELCEYCMLLVVIDVDKQTITRS